MLETECRIYAVLLGYCERLAADIDDARFAEQPSPGVNPPAWLIGHLAVASDLGVGLFGESRALSEEWHTLFGPGSTPTSDRSAYPSKAELLTTLRTAHERLSTLARSASIEQLARPNPSRFFKKELPTTGDILAHLLTSHEGMHLGHLSNWRRQVGLPYLF
jgi:hypothetical protein